MVVMKFGIIITHITDMMNIILVRIMFQKKFLMPQVLEDLNLKL